MTTRKKRKQKYGHEARRKKDIVKQLAYVMFCRKYNELVQSLCLSFFTDRGVKTPLSGPLVYCTILPSASNS